MPTDIPIISEYLKSYGYSNHMFGKWHLGSCSTRYTPMGRGFDTYQGRFLADSRFTSPITKKEKRVNRKQKRLHIAQARESRRLHRMQKRQNRKQKFSKRWHHNYYKQRFPRAVGGKRRPASMNPENYEANIARILQNSREFSQPFFMYLSFFTKAYPRFLEYDVAKDKKSIIMRMDSSIGWLINMLKKTNHWKRTIIMFLSNVFV